MRRATVHTLLNGTVATALALALSGAGIRAQAATAFTIIVTPPNCVSGCSADEPGLTAQGFDGGLYTTMPAQVGNGTGGTVVAFPPFVSPQINVPGMIVNGVYSSYPVVHQLVSSGPNASIEGLHPHSGVTLGTDGSFYVAAVDGGTGSGTIFKLTFQNPATAAQSNATAGYGLLHTFANGLDGAHPFAPPVQAPDGNLYGVTAAGTTSGNVYRVAPDGTGFGVIASLGVAMLDPLIVGEDGNLYGVTDSGGAYGFGMIFQSTLAGQVTPLYSFHGGTDGGRPHGRLLWGLDGMLYGTAAMGGAGSQGVIFRQDPHVVGAYTPIHPLAGNEGSSPLAGLVQGINGTLVGFASAGGTFGAGTIFAVDPVSGALTPLFAFSAANGVNPQSTPVLHTNGILYGSTTSGGVLANGGEGVTFSYDAHLPPFASVVGSVRSFPAGASFGVIGQGFLQATAVTVGPGAANFTAVGDTYMVVYAPGGCSGRIVVSEPGGSLTTPQVIGVGNASFAKFQVCRPVLRRPPINLPIPH
jgi:uncharacterized repeat protein (TIGR03803 family)